jgi:hypothetical protein
VQQAGQRQRHQQHQHQQRLQVLQLGGHRLLRGVGRVLPPLGRGAGEALLLRPVARGRGEEQEGEQQPRGGPACWRGRAIRG